MYKKKYLKYKHKYVQLKNKQYGGNSLFENDKLINEIISTVETNIRENITKDTEVLKELNPSEITKLNISSLKIENKLGEGQFGVVYDLSPNYVLKKVAIMHGSINKTKSILEEIRYSYYVEYINKTFPLYSGNLAHFKDERYFYLIMKKFKSLEILDRNIKTNYYLFDVAVSFICQLYVLTLILINNHIFHGDEKYDNLLFEDTRELIDNFEYSINGKTYKIKNCGFRLRLIDWGESSEILKETTEPMKPSWNEGWLICINEGIKGNKKSSSNKSAPTTDYLVSICKIIGNFGFNLPYLCFDKIFLNFFNNYTNYNQTQMEEFKFKLLFGQNDSTKIFNKIGFDKINGLFNTFKKLNETYKNSFLDFDEKINFENLDINKLPIFKKMQIGDTWNIQYCNSDEIKLNTNITYGEIKKNISSIKKYVSGNYSILKDAVGNCNNFERFNSGFPDYFLFYIDSLTTHKLDKSIYDHNLKSYFDKILKINSQFNQTFEDGLTYYTFVNSDKYLLLIRTKSDELGSVYLNVFVKEITDSKLNDDAVLKINYLKGAIATENLQIKKLFLTIRNSILCKKIKVVVFPLGLFHFHLNYNSLLDKYFGVVHAKFEITTELEYSTQEFGYMKKKVKYQGKDSTLIDLTLGTQDENKLEHNYVFDVDSSDNVNIYKLNCIPSFLENNDILNNEKQFGINDNFFNTNKFADVNYYYDPFIGEKKEYVIINKANTHSDVAANDDLFFNTIMPFKCKTNTETNTESNTENSENDTYKKEATEFGLSDSLIEQYIGLRKLNLSRDEVIAFFT